jgi:hypothetical protein
LPIFAILSHLSDQYDVWVVHRAIRKGDAGLRFFVAVAPSLFVRAGDFDLWRYLLQELLEVVFEKTGQS